MQGANNRDQEQGFASERVEGNTVLSTNDSRNLKSLKHTKPIS